MCRRVISSLILLTLIFNIGFPYSSHAINLPPPASLVALSQNYSLPVLRGLKIDPKNPLNIEFILDPGTDGKVDQEKASLLIRYFLAALTVPQDNLWVNLSTYEKDRVIPQALSQTDLGADMLAQDYILKQVAASITYPESETGKKYWQEMNGQNTFNKIWITAQKAKVYEGNNTAIIIDSKLKALMDADYLAMNKNGVIAAGQSARNDVFRRDILPLIEKDINEGKNFANLRQIYNAVILGKWFKEKFKESFYRAYLNKNNVNGVDAADKEAKEKIYDLYVEAFTKGAYNYTKKDFNPTTRRLTKRAYFSGGVVVDPNIETTQNQSDLPPVLRTGTKVAVRATLNPNGILGKAGKTLTAVALAGSIGLAAARSHAEPVSVPEKSNVTKIVPEENGVNLFYAGLGILASSAAIIAWLRNRRDNTNKSNTQPVPVKSDLDKLRDKLATLEDRLTFTPKTLPEPQPPTSGGISYDMGSTAWSEAIEAQVQADAAYASAHAAWEKDSSNPEYASLVSRRETLIANIADHAAAELAKASRFNFDILNPARSGISQHYATLENALLEMRRLQAASSNRDQIIYEIISRPHTILTIKELKALNASAENILPIINEVYKSTIQKMHSVTRYRSSRISVSYVQAQSADYDNNTNQAYSKQPEFTAEYSAYAEDITNMMNIRANLSNSESDNTNAQYEYPYVLNLLSAWFGKYKSELPINILQAIHEAHHMPGGYDDADKYAPMEQQLISGDPEAFEYFGAWIRRTNYGGTTGDFACDFGLSFEPADPPQYGQVKKVLVAGDIVTVNGRQVKVVETSTGRLLVTTGTPEQNARKIRHVLDAGLTIDQAQWLADEVLLGKAGKPLAILAWLRSRMNKSNAQPVPVKSDLEKLRDKLADLESKLHARDTTSTGTPTTISTEDQTTTSTDNQMFATGGLGYDNAGYSDWVKALDEGANDESNESKDGSTYSTSSELHDKIVGIKALLAREEKNSKLRDELAAAIKDLHGSAYVFSGNNDNLPKEFLDKQAQIENLARQILERAYFEADKNMSIQLLQEKIADSKHMIDVAIAWNLRFDTFLTDTQLTAILEAHKMEGGWREYVEGEKVDVKKNIRIVVRSDGKKLISTGTVEQNAAKIKHVVEAGLTTKQAKWLADEGWMGKEENIDANGNPVGGLSWDNTKVEKYGTGNFYFENIPDIKSIESMGFVINAITPNVTVSQFLN